VGQNTSTVALRIVEATEGESETWATLSLEDIHTETWSSRLLCKKMTEVKGGCLVHNIASNGQIWQNLLRRLWLKKKKAVFLITIRV
jgi:hypothetical protein